MGDPLSKSMVHYTILIHQFAFEVQLNVDSGIIRQYIYQYYIQKIKFAFRYFILIFPLKPPTIFQY
jgi:hypothetical protein